MNNKPGYILLLTLMLTGLSLLLISTVIYKATILSRYAAAYSEREKAKALAYSGVEIAISQLSSLLPKQEKNEQKKEDAEQEAKEKKDDPRKQMYAKLFSIINRWQTFALSGKEFEEEGEVKIYIACEQGKINIAHLFDFKKQEFINNPVDGKKIAEILFKNLGEQIKKEKLLSVFEQFMKEKVYPIQDVSELLLAKDFREYKQYLFPEFEGESAQEAQAEKVKKKILYLMDVFTIESGESLDNPVLLDPLVLSESVSILLGFNRQSTKDGQKWVKDFPDSPYKGQGYSNNWASGSWDKILAPLYKKEFKPIPDEIKKLFSNISQPTTFSVLVQANVGKITQKMYAIVHKDTTSNYFKIRKSYWL